MAKILIIDDEEQKRLVGCMDESGDRLLSITGELLNMTQIGDGRRFSVTLPV